MWNRFLKRSGIRSAAALLVALSLAGCYSFTGGGLPGHIRTVAVLPFENNTPQPLLETGIQQALQQQLPRNLGVRIAEQRVADAVVRGKVTGYEEVAASIRPTAGIQQEQVPVVQRQVRITYEAEIYDLREDKPLWRAQSQSVIGNFQPDSETAQEGLARAIRDLVNRVIEGAQSQW